MSEPQETEAAQPTRGEMQRIRELAVRETTRSRHARRSTGLGCEVEEVLWARLAVDADALDAVLARRELDAQEGEDERSE